MIARVFPRRTNATPDDAYAFIGEPPPLVPIDVTEVHVSCAFTWDIPRARAIEAAWHAWGYKTLLGGPAFGSLASEFEPGMYVKKGMTITSRGCIRRCPFCLVPEREGACIDCQPSIEDGELVWACDYHEMRRAKLIPLESAVKEASDDKA